MSHQIEIERKFVVCSEEWRTHASAKIHMQQGYICQCQGTSVRVRLENQIAKLNIKQISSNQLHTRHEFEYTIPEKEAKQLLSTIDPKKRIEKYRWPVMHLGKYWEVDEFLGLNKGLIIAEIELSNLNEAFVKPEWLSDEVTNDPRYYNINLAENPYADWC